MPNDAIFSEDGRYRYTLRRTWMMGSGICLFIMLNPSTADAETDDPTIRRCIGFAKAWGFSHLWVANLFAYRATDPKELLTIDDPVGPLNDDYIQAQADHSDLVVCAWGNGETPVKGRRGLDVKFMLEGAGTRLNLLGATKTHQPKHPLYLKATTTPIPWRS